MFCINFPLNAKFFGAPCFNVTVRLPNVSFLLDPVVKKVLFIGTCVDYPNWFAAVSPVAITAALSLFAISLTNSEAEG